jgi:hypothetical protein
VLICLSLLAAFAVVVSALVGSYSRRTATATAVSYATVSLFCAVPMFFWLGSATFGRDTVELLLVINPMAAALSVMETTGFQTYNLVPANWWIMGTLIVVLLLMLTWRTRRLLLPE